MAAVSIYALSAPYANFMLNQAPARSGVCRTCWTFIDPAYDECRQCAYGPTALVEAMVPITYSIDGEQMHHELRHYKDSRSAGVQQRMMRGLAAVLWRFLDEHELCIAEAAGRQGLFDLVVTVPSKSTVRDDQRSNLRTIVGSLCEHTAERYRRALRAADAPDTGRLFDPKRYRAAMPVHDKDLLLIDDTWTTGSSVLSAAHALRNAGARRVAAVVLGRHIKRGWQPTSATTNDALLHALPQPFDWDMCAVH